MRVVDGHRVAGALGEPREHLVPRQVLVAVELRREHLDPGRGGAEPDLALGRRERHRRDARHTALPTRR